MDAIRFLKVADSICGHVETDESFKIRRNVWHSLGPTGMEINDVEMCLSYTAKVLALTKSLAQTTKGYEHKTAQAYNQHAIGLIMAGDLLEAEKELRELASSQKLNLGYCLWLQGGSRLGDAKVILEDGLRHRIAKWGVDDTYSYK